MTRPTLLITGAAGGVATLLRPLLREQYQLRLVDRQEPVKAADEEAVVGDLLDPEFALAVVNDADAVLHLAGNPSARAEWASLEPANVRMTEHLLAAAAKVGVRRFVFASSIHAGGAYVQEKAIPVDPAWPARPCCLYGASKAAGEALGWVYAHTTKLAVVNLRIGLAVARPDRPFARDAWVSPRDLAQLVRRSLTTDIQYGVYFALSSNRRRLWNIDNAHDDLGYRPADNSADWADGHVHETDTTRLLRSPCFEGDRSVFSGKAST